MTQEPECELLPKCGFFKKYQSTDEFACIGFISMYCRGPRMAECKRMQYRLEHGTPPPDDMLPTGSTLKSIEGRQPSIT